MFVERIKCHIDSLCNNTSGAHTAIDLKAMHIKQQTIKDWYAYRMALRNRRS
jgi:hypothetical protein